jgi:hypothetical protein
MCQEVLVVTNTTIKREGSGARALAWHVVLIRCKEEDLTRDGQRRPHGTDFRQDVGHETHRHRVTGGHPSGFGGEARREHRTGIGGQGGRGHPSGIIGTGGGRRFSNIGGADWEKRARLPVRKLIGLVHK